MPILPQAGTLALVDTALAEFGGIGILVNKIGGGDPGRLGSRTPREQRAKLVGAQTKCLRRGHSQSADAAGRRSPANPLLICHF
jgi:hypothetical protein